MIIMYLVLSRLFVIVSCTSIVPTFLAFLFVIMVIQTTVRTRRKKLALGGISIANPCWITLIKIGRMYRMNKNQYILSLNSVSFKTMRNA